MSDLREALLGAIARGWCSQKNAHKVMDPDLVEAIADEVAALSAEPAQEMTDLQLDGLRDAHEREWGVKPGIYSYASFRKMFRSVIAADRASRFPEMGEGDWPELPAPEERPGGQRGCGLSAAQCRAYAVAAVEAYKALVRWKS